MRVRVQDQNLNLNLMLNTCARDLTAETRDLKMFPVTRHQGLPPAMEAERYNYVVTRSRPYPAHTVPILYTQYSIL